MTAVVSNPCIKCAYHESGCIYNMCYHPNLGSDRLLEAISGRRSRMGDTCRAARGHEDMCGLSGRWFAKRRWWRWRV